MICKKENKFKQSYVYVINIYASATFYVLMRIYYFPSWNKESNTLQIISINFIKLKCYLIFCKAFKILYQSDTKTLSMLLFIYARQKETLKQENVVEIGL